MPDNVIVHRYCDHKHWRVRPTDQTGSGYCEDCANTYPIAVLVNAMQERIEKVTKALEAATAEAFPAEQVSGVRMVSQSMVVEKPGIQINVTLACPKCGKDYPFQQFVDPNVPLVIPTLHCPADLVVLDTLAIAEAVVMAVVEEKFK